MKPVAIAIALIAALIADPTLAASERINVDGDARRYRLAAPAQTPAPLVIALHAEGQLASDMQKKMGLENEAKARGWAIAFPIGAGNSWASAQRPDALRRDRARATDDVAFLDALITKLEERGIAREGAIFLAGYGRGGMMAQRYACARADRIIGFAMVGALAHAGERCEPRTAAAALLILGEDDGDAPIDGGSMGAKRMPGGWGEAASLDATMQPWFARSGCRGWGPAIQRDLKPDGLAALWRDASGCAAPLRTITILGGGHYWPGADELEIKPIRGVRPRGLNAAEEIAALFAAAQ